MDNKAHTEKESAQRAKRWIIILNRSPKGPVSASEILLLLEKGLLRRNDLACLVEEKSDVKSEWKLIWQFDEFDRRSAENIEAEKSKKTEKQKTAPSERRVNQLSTEEIRQQALKELPSDWQDIAPEDLLPSSKNQGVPEHVTNELFEGGQANWGRSFEWSLWAYKYLPTAAAVLTGIGLYYFMPSFWLKVPPKTSLVTPHERQLSLPKRLPADMRQDDAPSPEALKAPVMRSRVAVPMDTEEPVLESREPDAGEVIEEPPKKKAKKSTIRAKKMNKAAEFEEEEAEESDEERENASIEEEAPEENPEEEQEP